MLTNKEKDKLNMWLQISLNPSSPGPLTVNQCARRAVGLIDELLKTKDDKLKLINIMQGR